MVSFTGGLATGKIIAKNAAETVKRTALESVGPPIWSALTKR